jgi:hypothetical protein
MSYKIVRFYSREPRSGRGGHIETKKRTMERGLTLDQAQCHCNDPTTEGTMPKSGGGWKFFDGYYEE